MMKKSLTLLVLILLVFGITACVEGTTESTIEGITIDVTPSSLMMHVDETEQLTVTSNDTEGLTYAVSPEGIVSVSDTGMVSALSLGEATITVTSETNPEVSVAIDVEVVEEIFVSTDVTEVDVNVGLTHTLDVSSNDTLVYASSDPDVATVDEDGIITGVGTGVTTVTATAVTDASKSITVTVTVDEAIQIHVNTSDYALVVDDTGDLDVDSNGELAFESGDTNIVTVDQDGVMTAVAFGETFIRITSAVDPSLTEDVTVHVYKQTESIAISGETLLIKGMDSDYAIAATPVGGYEEVIWESTDESILTVDAGGTVTAVGTGTTTIVARSKADETVADTFEIKVVDVLVVDQSKQSGDTYDYQGLELSFGVQLFASLDEALAEADANTKIFIEDGQYAEDVILEDQGIELIGLSYDAVIQGSIDVRADGIHVRDLSFTGGASIVNDQPINGFVFESNHVSDITASDRPFLSLSGIAGVKIAANTFDNLAGDAIRLSGVNGAGAEVSHNVIDGADTAIHVDLAESVGTETDIRLFWNQIADVSLAFSVDMLTGGTEADIFKAARFNDVTNYAEAVNANAGSTFDFTLNHWGVETLDMADFDQVDPHYLKGMYTDSADMPSESEYDPTLPVKLNITNPIDEIMIGETHVFEYEILPYELSDAPVRFITGDPDLVQINLDNEGEIIPLSSGEVYIQLRSAQVSSIRTQVNFRIITTPGIEITTSHVSSDVIVGDTFTLDTILFPYTIEGDTATITSSAPQVASIDETGLVTAHAEGLVTFTATLDSDPTVTQTYTVYVHGSLDPEHNLLDYLTTKQITYSAIHEWTAYGFQYNYHDTRAESVSRYYFGELSINQSKMIPVTYGIRPGEPMDPLPDGVTQYNPHNVHWIVVHDTASTATGSNALAHANYLWNNSVTETPLWASWHFSIDDHDIYQHIPETERAYHAGDGSSQPTLNDPYLGGGNRNGIGIEMCINDDGDMYRTWQRNAKFVASLLIKYNLPLDHQTYHNDFSGKDCPRTLRNAGLVPLFEEFVATEHYVQTHYPDAEITLTSNNPDYLDDHGRIIQIPDRAMTVSYTISVTVDGITESRTFHTYLPGTVR